ncbi:MAG: Na+/H+ antiporter NhaC family protein [Opitutales bacterium]
MSTWLWSGWGGDWIALWPSLLALALVLVFRRVIIALLGGALAGAVMLEGGNPLAGFVALVEAHLLPQFSSPWNTGALIFTLVLGGFATVLERGGALEAWLGRLTRTGSGRRVESVAMGFGVLCFFDGLANSLMVGRLFRGLADRAGVARARLAYSVDTTSAAVACVSFISTWIAFQLSQIQAGLEQAGRPDFASPYALFFASIPYNFYCWFALILLGLAIWRQWDIGPMRGLRAAAVPTPTAQVLEGAFTADDHAPGRWRFFLPLGLLVALLLGGIYADGGATLRAEGSALEGTARVAAAFGAADAAVVMVWVSLLAAGVAIVCYPPAAGGMSRGLAVFEEGVLALFKPAMILVAAWLLGSVANALDAAEVLSGLVSERIPFALLPAAVFLVAAGTSFTTGTSWGTMAIIMPLSIPLAFALGAEASPAVLEHVLAGLVAAVFSGAVFGDHCSPLSDTTIVSSVAVGIEPHEHVRTQMPYALLAAGVALGFGFIPLVAVPVPGLMLVAGTLLLAALAIFRTRRPAPAS